MPDHLPRYERAGGLEAAEAASPVDAVGAVTRGLGRAPGALSVSFAIAGGYGGERTTVASADQSGASTGTAQP